MNKSLMILVLMVCLVSSVWAQKEGDADVQAYAGESFSNRATWANHMLYDGTATLRDIVIGTKIKGATDDTIRLFTVQSSAPRNVMLMTDTSTSSTTPMENRWIVDTLYQPGAGFYCAAIGDVDRDGDNDLVFGRSSSPYRLMWKYWTGTGWNTDDTVITTLGTGRYIYDVAIGDADNDGNADDVIFGGGQTVMRAWWNGASWDTATIWTGDGSSCYGVAIGDFDANHAGNEIVAVTYGVGSSATVQEIMWNTGTTSWDTYTMVTAPGDWDLRCVQVGDFDADNPGAEVACGNSYQTNIHGSVIEVYGSGTSWSYTPIYTPAGTETCYNLDIGDFLDEHTGNEVVFVSSSSPYNVRAIYGAGTTWSDQVIFSTGGTSYGVDAGNVDQYRMINDEIAVTGGYDVFEAEQYWYANELAITAGGQLTYPFVISEAESVWARVKNAGTNIQNNFKVYLYLNGVAAESVDVATLAAGDSVDLAFGFVPAAQGEINFTIFHSLAPDDYPVNDTLGTIDPVAGFPNRFHDWVFETGTYKAEGFEYLSSFPPPGWVVINNDGGTYQWNWYTSSTNSTYMHSGIIYASCHYETSTLRNDDWLITDMVSPAAGVADSIGFFCRSYFGSTAESLEVWVMSGQTLNDTVALIWAINIASATYLPFKLSLDDYDGQNIYLAFRYVSLYEWYIDVDDIYWTSNVDATGPDITLIEMPEDTYDPVGPYTVRAVITDPSGVLADSLYYIVDDLMTRVTHTSVAGDTFTYEIAGQAAGTVIDYYVSAWDVIPNMSTSSTQRFWVLSPLAPTDLTASEQADSTILLEWLPPGEELSYHGAPYYYWSGWLVNDMMATQFTPQHSPCKLEAASIMFSQVMDTVEFRVWADDGSGNPGNVLYVDTIIVSNLNPNPEVIDLSGEDIVIASGDFHVGLVWLGADSPYPMSDNGASTTRSKWGDATGWYALGFDWVMSAVVTYVAPTPDAVVARTNRISTVATLNIKNTAASSRDSEHLTRHDVRHTYDLSVNLLERVLGISNFEVGRSEAQGGPYDSLGTTNQSSYVDNTVVSEIQYYYVVIANYTAPDTFSYYSNEVAIGVDFTPPIYANTTYDSLVAGPWVVSTDITDWSHLAYDSLGYRTDGGAFVFVGNDSVSGNTYYYTIPDFPSYTLIEFYLFCQDDSWWQNTGRDPESDYYAFTVTAIHEYKKRGLIPDRVFFSQNRPNPFAHLTQIEYGVPRSMQVNISVYNAAGQRVSTLVDENKAPGFYMVNWRGTDDLGRRLSEGVYFMRMTTDELTDTKKVIYIK